jgi:hypothetical protein
MNRSRPRVVRSHNESRQTGAMKLPRVVTKGRASARPCSTTEPQSLHAPAFPSAALTRAGGYYFSARLVIDSAVAGTLSINSSPRSGCPDDNHSVPLPPAPHPRAAPGCRLTNYHLVEIKKGFKRACELTGIPHGQNQPGELTFHDLRHTFATRLAERGALRSVGHEDGAPLQPRDSRGPAGCRREARTEGRRGAGISAQGWLRVTIRSPSAPEIEKRVGALFS